MLVFGIYLTFELYLLVNLAHHSMTRDIINAATAAHARVYRDLRFPTLVLVVGFPSRSSKMTSLIFFFTSRL
jgi:hypothetical protein